MLVDRVEELATPLTRKIAQFSRVLLWIILGLSGVTMIVGAVVFIVVEIEKKITTSGAASSDML